MGALSGHRNLGKPQQPCPVGPLPRGTNQKAGTPDVNEMVCISHHSAEQTPGATAGAPASACRPRSARPHAGQSPEGSARKLLGPGAGTLAPGMAGTAEWGGAPRFHPHGKASSGGKDQGLPPCLPKLPLKSQQSKRLCTLPCGEHPTAAALPSAHRVARAPAPFLHTGNKFRGSCSTSSPSRGSERGPSSAWPSRRLSGEQSPPHPHPLTSSCPCRPSSGSPWGGRSVPPSAGGEQVLWVGHRPPALPTGLPSLQSCRETRTGTGWLAAHPKWGRRSLGPALPAAAPSDPSKHGSPARPLEDGEGRACSPAHGHPRALDPRPLPGAPRAPSPVLPSCLRPGQWSLLQTCLTVVD